MFLDTQTTIEEAKDFGESLALVSTETDRLQTALSYYKELCARMAIASNKVEYLTYHAGSPSDMSTAMLNLQISAAQRLALCDFFRALRINIDNFDP